MAICPILSNADKEVNCLKEKCAMYFKPEVKKETLFREDTVITEGCSILMLVKQLILIRGQLLGRK